MFSNLNGRSLAPYYFGDAHFVIWEHNGKQFCERYKLATSLKKIVAEFEQYKIDKINTDPEKIIGVVHVFWNK